MTFEDLVIHKNDNALVAAAKAQIREMIKGKTQAASEIADRLEGPVPRQISGPGGGPIPVSFDDAKDALDALLQEVKQQKEDEPK